MVTLPKNPPHASTTKISFKMLQISWLSWCRLKAYFSGQRTTAINLKACHKVCQRRNLEETRLMLRSRTLLRTIFSLMFIYEVMEKVVHRKQMQGLSLEKALHWDAHVGKAMISSPPSGWSKPTWVSSSHLDKNVVSKLWVEPFL